MTLQIAWSKDSCPKHGTKVVFRLNIVHTFMDDITSISISFIKQVTDINKLIKSDFFDKHSNK